MGPNVKGPSPFTGLFPRPFVVPLPCGFPVAYFPFNLSSACVCDLYPPIACTITLMENPKVCCFRPSPRLTILTATNQPTNQPTNPPTNHPINQSINQPTNQSITSSPNQPTNPPTHQPTHQPNSQSINQSTNHPLAQPTNQSINQPTKQPTHLFFTYIYIYS